MVAVTLLACRSKLPTEQGEKMDYMEAKQLVKERAGSKYANSGLHLLERMVRGLYKPNKENAPIENVRVTKRVTTLCLWGGVKTRQLHNVLKSLAEVEIVSRKNGSITYTLDLEPLKGLPKTVDVVRSRDKEHKADRAGKARTQRRKNRQTNRVADVQKLLNELRPRFFQSMLKPSKAAAQPVAAHVTGAQVAR
jgi:hypothetical protein